jgi:Secretion system C-terminal sorting domain
MKKIVTSFLLITVLSLQGFSQYFQATFTNVGNVITVKVRPTATIPNSKIGNFIFAFRYNVASTPSFTIGNVQENQTNFPGLAFTIADVYNDGTYNYKQFAFTSTTTNAVTYTGGVEYEAVKFSLIGQDNTANLELVSNVDDLNYFFSMADGAGSEFSTGTNDQFYGPGFRREGALSNTHILPLNNVPVPVKFLGFDVSKKGNSALLKWSVENETALTDKYIIETSANSIDYKPVATIQSNYNGRGNNTYSFTQDNLSAVKSSGVIYYRIKQIDKDGKFVYTPIRNVRLDGKAFAVNAYPNPVKNNTKLTIDLLNESRIIISVTDGGGKQVKTMQIQGFKGPNIKDLNLSNLSSGSYMMKVQAGAEVKSITLVKVD